MKYLFILALVLAKMAVATLGAADAITPTDLGPEPGCFPGDECDS